MIVISTSGANAGESDALLFDSALESSAILENAIHRASHALSNANHRSAPQWWREGLAVYDAPAVLRSDETVCSGAADPSDLAALGPGVDWTGLASRFKSPYRGTVAARYFLESLRRAWGPDGFEIADLDTNRASYRAPAPSLSDGAETPPIVMSAPPGVRKCYAEFQRAYAAAFLHFLDGDGGPASTSTLQTLSRAMVRESRADLRRFTSLYKLSAHATSRSIRASRDPAKDHEGAFLAWLTR